MSTYMLIVNETAPGFVRPEDVEQLHNLAGGLGALNAHHLGTTLGAMAHALSEGRVVKVTIEDGTQDT